MLFGLILIFISILLCFFAYRTSTTAGKYKAYVPVDNVRGLPDGIPVVVDGTITAAQPLVAPLTQKTCVFYHYMVEEQVEERDKNGNISLVWRQVGTPEEERIAFSLQDETGTIAIKPDNCILDTPTVTERFLSPGSIPAIKGHPILSVIASMAMASAPTRERVIERIFPTGITANVFGILSLEGDEKFFQQTNQYPLLVTTKSKDQIINAVQQQIYVIYGVSAITMLLGIYFLIRH